MTRLGKNSIIIATVLAGILTGCGGSSNSTPTTAVVADVVVTAENGLRFGQSSYSAKAGDLSVAFVNNDTIHHMLVVVNDGTQVGGFELSVSKKGDVDRGMVSLEPGTYILMCTVPGHQNMKADFTVS